MAAVTKFTSILVAAASYQKEMGCCLAFATPSARLRSSAVLSGLANVNDYFDSFKNINDNEEDEKRRGKYMGHGRIGGDGEEGGVFDINNYFSSFDDGGDNNEEDMSSAAEEQEPPDPPQEARRMTYEEIVAYNNARLCPKMLLTQRAIQSFIYLLEECRDPHSGKWIEDFLEVQNLGNFHGTGAFNITKYPTWNAVLYDIMNQPNTKLIVSAKRRGRGHGGWSKNNPYLQERWVEFKIDIRPASLVQRLLPVREQIAEEFLHDLEIIGVIDGMIMDSYFTRLREGTPSTSAAFDRTSILANFTQFEESGTESSPFRRGNFDLLYNLCTQAAAHCFLRALQSTSSEDDVTFQWFKGFYTENIPQYFDGDGSFGRGDDFIDALLRTPPTVKEGQTSVTLTDPMAVAENIIRLRSTVAEEWKGMMMEVKGDHIELSTVLTRIIFGRSMDESGNDIVEIQEENTVDELSESGAFE